MGGQIVGHRRNEDRHERDLYPTHPAWTECLLDRMKLKGKVWEPAAGDGAICDVLTEWGYDWTGSDLQAGTDFLTSSDRAGTIITNPPYSLMDEFILHGLQQADQMLALLLGWHRIAGGMRRRRLWMEHPPALVQVIVPRMPVYGVTSQFNHAWVVWTRPDRKAEWTRGPTQLEWAEARR